MDVEAYTEACQKMWNFWQTMSVKCVGGGATVPHCPLCPGVHECCEFVAGSIYCAKVGCGNPHHRVDPCEGDCVDAGWVDEVWTDAMP